MTCGEPVADTHKKSAIFPQYELIFGALAGDKQASFDFNELTADDHALLAQLVARLRPDDKEAQSMAGIYLEINGQTREADDCYEKAGPELKEMSDSLFE